MNMPEFLVGVGLKEGSALSPFLFALVMDPLTVHLQGVLSTFQVLVHNVILISEIRKQEIRKQANDMIEF